MGNYKKRCFCLVAHLSRLNCIGSLKVFNNIKLWAPNLSSNLKKLGFLARVLAKALNLLVLFFLLCGLLKISLIGLGSNTVYLTPPSSLLAFHSKDIWIIPRLFLVIAMKCQANSCQFYQSLNLSGSYFWEVDKPLWDVWKQKTQILIAHQKEDIDQTQKSFLAGKKSTARV